MKTVAIIDPTSMVGSMVFQVLKDQTRFVLVFGNREDADLLEKIYGGTSKHRILVYNPLDTYQDYVDGFPSTTYGSRTKKAFTDIGQIDTVLNCITVVKPHLLENPIVTHFINAAWPQILSRWFGSKLIHLSTDCVFSGLEGAPYTEDAPISPTDLYGLTRSLGEPSSRSLVIRTSTIGPEIKNFDSLIAWVKKQAGQTIKGFTQHLWNGITTKQFAESIEQIIKQRDQYPKHGLFHIFGSDVSKFDMITAIARKYQVDVKITPDDGPRLDRRLRTIKGLNDQLHIPSFNELISAL